MNKTLLAITTTLSLTLSAQAMADGYRHHHFERRAQYAKVVSVQPVYKTVRIAYEEKHCRQDHRQDRHRHHIGFVSPEKLLLGGLIGGALGHELGENHNRDLATFTGAVIGTAIAQSTNAAYYPVDRRDREQPPACHTEIHYRNQQQLVAYEVTYRYRGHFYTTRMRENPAEWIPIDDVRHHHRDRHH